jgi:hypothetical protein
VTLRNNRVQPFALLLQSNGAQLLVRCISPIGRVGAAAQDPTIIEAAARRPGRIGAILTEDAAQYDLTVEDDVVLAAPEHDSARVALLLKRVLESADAIEYHQFGDTDHRMGAFETDLRKEGSNGRN